MRSGSTRSIHMMQATDRHRVSKMISMLCVLATSISRAHSGTELKLQLRTSKSTYRLGEQIVFEYRFTNSRSNTITFFPDPELYYPEAVTLRPRDRAGTVTEIDLVERSMDARTWSKDAVVLKAGESYVRKISCDFRRELPREWLKYLRGDVSASDPNRPYLVFAGASALRLAGFGEYTAIGNYKFQRNHSVVEFIARPFPTWFGTVQSEPVSVRLDQ